MGIVLMHKGRPVTEDDLAAIRALMSERATWTRRSLSLILCERRGWVQENGAPRDAVCRALLLALSSRGAHRASGAALGVPRALASTASSEGRGRDLSDRGDAARAGSHRAAPGDADGG